MGFGVHTGTPVRILRQLQLQWNTQSATRVWIGWDAQPWEQLAEESRRRNDTCVFCALCVDSEPPEAIVSEASADRPIEVKACWAMHVNDRKECRVC